MRMGSRSSRLWLVVAIISWSICYTAEAKTKPLSVTPSDKWYGDDGSWSAVSIKIGQPQQQLDVMVSTASSEITVVASTACETEACATARGATFDSSQSNSWKSQGIHSLGLDSVLGSDVDGTFGLDTLTYGTTGISVKNTAIGAFNDTEFWLGFFGLGISSDTSDNTSELSPISQLVETMSDIPSHSYGYTAGASYRNNGGSPNSLTLGGMDARRYISHDFSFELNSQKQPSTYINSLYLSLPDGSAIPLNWPNSSPRLADAGQMVTALIDSSTPYLWLPEEVCENFASVLNLTYNSTLNLYTFDGNETQHAALQALNFSISLELAQEPSSIETVTIELPYEAFDQQMTSPYTKYYFPIKRATNESQYTLGRTFLQEAYLIVDYERGNFSVHQALFPTDAATNTSGVTEISRPADSKYTGPDSHPQGGMPKATIAGIAVGCVALVTLLIIANFYRIRYNRLKAAQNPQLSPEKPKSKADLLLTKLNIGRRQSRQPRPPKAVVYETEGNATYPIEIGGDLTHERFELAAPMTPVELDSDTTRTHISGTTANDSQISQLSEYEREQLKLQAAMQRGNIATSFPEKTDVNTHEGGTYRSEHSTVSAASTNTYDLSPSSTSHLMGEILSPLSPMRDPPPSYQRNAQNMIPSGAEIVYAGPMPNISPGMEVGFLPDRRADLSALSLDSPGFRLGGGNIRDTLGSNYTVEETRTMEMEMEMEREMEREHEEMMSPAGLDRSLEVQDLVHVPQVAARRYSWESGA